MKMINGHIACVLINTNPSLDNEKKKKGKEKKNQTKQKNPSSLNRHNMHAFKQSKPGRWVCSK